MGKLSQAISISDCEIVILSIILQNLHINIINPRQRRPLPGPFNEPVYFRIVTLGHEFNSTIRQIPDIPVNA